MSSENEKYKVPELGVKDVAHTIAKTVLGVITTGGASELFNTLIKPSIEKRRIKWMEEVAEGLRKLEKNKGIRLEDLQSNEPFIDATIKASQAAMRTNQKEKLEALRNAVLNSASYSHLDDDIQQIFLNFVDIFSTWHLRLLNFLKAPPSGGVPLLDDHTHIHLSVLPKSIESTFPQLKNQFAFYNQIIKELSDRGLVDLSASDTSHDMATMQGIPSVKITDLGGQFLQFIATPFDDEDE